MDRTNWEFGRKTINFLAVSIIVGKVSIPIIWTVLPKKTKGGNSNTKQRMSLMKKLLRILPSSDIHVLTLDREFVGKQWLSYLDEKDIGYVVRLKKNAYVGWRHAIDYARKSGRKVVRREEIFSLQLFFASKTMKSGGRATHLLVASNRFTGKEALKLYRMRWGIERLFGHLKKNGFDLEATHMSDPTKLEKLFAVVTIAYIISFAWGCHLRAKRHRISAKSERKSLFRLGLEDILRLVSPGKTTERIRDDLRIFLRWLNLSQFNSIFLV